VVTRWAGVACCGPHGGSELTRGTAKMCGWFTDFCWEIEKWASSTKK
jgi:hypothetical protein